MPKDPVFKNPGLAINEKHDKRLCQSLRRLLSLPKTMLDPAPAEAAGFAGVAGVAGVAAARGAGVAGVAAAGRAGAAGDTLLCSASEGFQRLSSYIWF